MRTLIIVGLLLRLSSLVAADDAVTLRDAGYAALRESQSNPDAIVKAAESFAKAAELFEKDGHDSDAREMNSYLFWCRKKMTLTQIESIQNADAGGRTITQRLEKAASEPVNGDSVEKYVKAADAFAAAHPDDHFLVAIRYFEIAERFKGTDASLKAQETSLREMQQVTVAAKSIPNNAAQGMKQRILIRLPFDRAVHEAPQPAPQEHFGIRVIKTQHRSKRRCRYDQVVASARFYTIRLDLAQSSFQSLCTFRCPTSRPAMSTRSMYLRLPRSITRSRF